MASRYLWTNDDGLQVPSGRRTVENDAPGKSALTGVEEEISFVIPQSDIVDEPVSGYGAVLPAGANLTDVQLHSSGALTALVGLIVGVEDADGGSDITDADGLVLAIPAAEVVALRPTGTVVGTDYDGALLTSAAPLAEAARITWAATTASGAGDITVVVKYIPDQV